MADLSNRSTALADAGRAAVAEPVVVTGLPAAPGVAIGPIWRYEPAVGGGTPRASIADAAAAPAELERAAAEAARRLDDLAAALRSRGAADEAAILEAQALMAEDPALIGEAVRLAAEGRDPVAAIRAAAEPLAAMLAKLDDPVLAARSADVLDVAERIARILLGAAIEPPLAPAVAVADDLPPSVTAELPEGTLLGICLERGTPLAHAAILARALGIPAVVGASGLLVAVAAVADVSAGRGPSEIAIDGGSGRVVVSPGPLDRTAFAERMTAFATRRARVAAQPRGPGMTANGQRVRLLANIGSPREIERALAAGAEGVGLLRTEFLFMERTRPPSEDEQVAAYRAVFGAFGRERPVVVRLADIGGDKPLPYLAMPVEPNPFLGLRGIRLATRSPGMFVTQLRAISRAAAEAGVVPHVMAPMVATAEDIALFRDLAGQAQAGLVTDGLPCAERLESGIMVEVPSAVLLAAELARSADFFSIGTNDLTQYLFAADRTESLLGHLQDSLHPAVLRAVAMVVAGADAADIQVAVCGELAGDPAGALVLVGLGVDELSADPNSLEGIRSALAAATTKELRQLASAATAAEDGAAVRRLASPILERSAAA